MRGMIKGEWQINIDNKTTGSATSAGNDTAVAFNTPAARVPIDRERLAHNPETYVLYAARACPFAHRTLLARSLCGLNALPVRYMHPWLGGPNGWMLNGHGTSPCESTTHVDTACIPDVRYLWELYRASDRVYTGRVSVPVLWDCEAQAIASAESREIVDAIVATQALRGRQPAVYGTDGNAAHAELADAIGEHINIGIYRIGFAGSQAEYDHAHTALHTALRSLEQRTPAQNYLCGNRPGIADLMLFATAIRFDAAYHGAFLLLDMLWHHFPHLEAHRQRMMRLPGITETLSFEDYRIHYFDDAAFSVRHRGVDGHFIVPRTFNKDATEALSPAHSQQCVSLSV